MVAAQCLLSVAPTRPGLCSVRQGVAAPFSAPRFTRRTLRTCRPLTRAALAVEIPPATGDLKPKDKNAELAINGE